MLKIFSIRLGFNRKRVLGRNSPVINTISVLIPVWAIRQTISLTPLEDGSISPRGLSSRVSIICAISIP